MEPRETADLLTQLKHRFGYSGRAMAARSREMGEQYALNPNFIANIRHKGVVPNLWHLHAISELFQLTLGSTFSLFGFDLDRLIETELALNEERTRLIEHMSFGPREVSVPSRLGAAFATGTTAFLSQLVEAWEEVPAKRVRGAGWSTQRCLYGKLGIFDSDAAPEIPPGAYVQIVPLRGEQPNRLLPDAIYFVQHPQGYTACHCGIEDETLVLYPRDPSFPNPRRWKLHREAILLGMVTAFGAALPAEGYRRAFPKARPRVSPAPIAPWQHRSLHEQFRANCQRFGLRRADIDRFNAELLSRHGIHVSGQYGLSAQPVHQVAQTSTALAMAITASLRLRDVFRTFGLTVEDRNKYSLSDLLENRAASTAHSAPTSIRGPEPRELWAAFLRDWREWPMLLQRTTPFPEKIDQEVLQLGRDSLLRGMERLLRPGSIVRIDPRSVPLGGIHRDAHESDWTRRLYVIEVGRSSPTLLCGYLLVEDRFVILTPHPAARSTESMKFGRSEVQILGQVTGILARVV